MTPLELRMQQKQVQAWVDADPITLRLNRPTWVTTPARGRKEGPAVTLPPQRFRLAPYLRRMTDSTVNTPDGDITNINYTLVGKPDADVQKDDEFVYNGGRYRVHSVSAATSVRKASVVTYMGDANA